jgi:hypothetical protein
MFDGKTYMHEEHFLRNMCDGTTAEQFYEEV